MNAGGGTAGHRRFQQSTQLCRSSVVEKTAGRIEISTSGRSLPFPPCSPRTRRRCTPRGVRANMTLDTTRMERTRRWCFRELLHRRIRHG
jgi:hypothetical protein